MVLLPAGTVALGLFLSKSSGWLDNNSDTTAASQSMVEVCCYRFRIINNRLVTILATQTCI